MTASATIADEVRALERQGDFFRAHDRALDGLRAAPDDRALGYLAVRTLARCGATRRALALYDSHGLDAAEDTDTLALRARIAKDAAFEAEGMDRKNQLLAAAELYRAVFERQREHYPAVNAATLYLLAGDLDQAEIHAFAAIDACKVETPDGALARYYNAASRAEALLITQDTAEAMEALNEAARLSRDDLAARAATRRQLQRVCAARGLNESILQPLAPPGVLHYSGHMLRPVDARKDGGRTDYDPDSAAAEIGDYLAARRYGFAYGALASGVDILVAEAALAAGLALHVVLPFPEADFIARSVRPAGGNWEARFSRCLGAAASVVYASDAALSDDENMFAYGARLAMGLAALRAQFIGAEVRQLAVWDEAPAEGEAGTAVDVAAWRVAGRETDTIPVKRKKRKTRRAVASSPSGPHSAGADAPEPKRALRALIFGDVAGFSRIPEPLLPVFHRRFMGALADAIDGFGGAVDDRDSWGDAIHVVLSDAEAGARCALAIQQAVRDFDAATWDLPGDLGLRLSAHYAPVFHGRHWVKGKDAYYGMHVTRAARIEPITPVGEVYVTEAMAAELALSGARDMVTEYVGVVPTAKNYGAFPMYLLRKTS